MNIEQSVMHNLIYKKFYASTSQSWEQYSTDMFSKTMFNVTGLTKDDVNTQTTACTLSPMLSGTLKIKLSCKASVSNTSQKCNIKIINAADETDILLDETLSPSSNTTDRFIEVAAYKTYKVIYTPINISSSGTLTITGTASAQIIDNPDMYIQVFKELTKTEE